MRTLITFGAQHMGVSDIPACSPRDVSCALMHRAARAGVYTAWAQRALVQAQYFRDPARMAAYLARNTFLPDVNGELAAARNASYGANLARLEHLVLVMFGKDVTVVPKESAWFGSERPPPDGLAPVPARVGQAPLHAPKPPPPPEAIIPMREQPLYAEDWIGLRALDEAGKVRLEVCDEPHMHIPPECWEDLVRTYVGGPVDA
jgi:palmitoyl-protein thioesterase